MLYFSWVKETAEVVQYEALFPLHPFVDIFHYYRLKNRFRHSLCLAIVLVGMQLVQLWDLLPWKNM